MSHFLTFLLTSTTALILTDQNLLSNYQAFLATNNLSYSTFEQQTRFETFNSNLHFIQESNSKSQSFTLKIGPNADKSPEDFPILPHSPSQTQLADLPDTPVPDSIDWVKQGMVSPLKTINKCNAPWAFAAIDTIESIIAITNNVPAFSLSVQQVISCSDPFGNVGCISGNLINSFTFAQNSVLCTASQYPFVDSDSSCRRKFFCQNGISSFSGLQGKNETVLKVAVAQQPVAVTLNVTNALLHYGGGILTASGCGSALQQSYFVLVGYGSVAGNDFWVVRGYWGSGWGIGGYAMIQRNDLNVNTTGACGIAFDSYIPNFSN